jgi:pectinesterase inhibitor-like protein
LYIKIMYVPQHVRHHIRHKLAAYTSCYSTNTSLIANMGAACSPSISSLGALLLFSTLYVVATGSEITVNSNDQNVIFAACKTVGGGSAFFDVEFCMSALGSDGRSYSADSYSNFSAIAVDLVTASATSTAAKINGLLVKDSGAKDDAATTRCLSSCRPLYGGILQRQPGCAAAVKDGKFGEATASLEKSAAAAKECEAGFGRNKVASPLTVEDDSAFKLAKLAVALLRFAV